MSHLAQIIVGHCIPALRSMTSASVDCCVTSPPYWGLRDYSARGQIGLESCPEEWCDTLVQVFDEVRRVLRPTGTLWLNLGDSYAGSGRAGYPGDCGTLEGSTEGQDRSRLARVTVSRRRDRREIPRSDRAVRGCKPKDLIGQPWMVAFALRAAGWHLRSDIIWHKPNPMPESCRDRPTKAHEYVFLLSKERKYYFDGKAIAEPCSPNTHLRVSQDLANQVGSARAHAGGKHNGTMKAVLGRNAIVPDAKARATAARDHRGTTPKQNAHFAAAHLLPVLERNSRSVWTIPTRGYKGAHFATFPRELAARCIRAGCPVGGLVLDPFAGTGTTIAEAVVLDRRGVGIELSRKYARLAEQRIEHTCGIRVKATRLS